MSIGNTNLEETFDAKMMALRISLEEVCSPAKMRFILHLMDDIMQVRLAQAQQAHGGQRTEDNDQGAGTTHS